MPETPKKESFKNLGMFVILYVFTWPLSRAFMLDFPEIHSFLVSPPPVEESAQIGDSAPHRRFNKPEVNGGMDELMYQLHNP